MSKDIRQIHPFGPAVGKWQSHGTVAETIARAKRTLKQEQDKQRANEQEATAKVKPMRGKA